jgi:hypothetical protein
MSNLAARQAIEQYLAATSAVPACIFENSGQVPPDNAAFLLGFFMPAQPDDQEAGSANTRLNGLYQITLMYPAGAGVGDAEAFAEVLRQRFKRATTLTQSGLHVMITHTPQVAQGKPDGSSWAIPVTLRWQAWTT